MCFVLRNGRDYVFLYSVPEIFIYLRTRRLYSNAIITKRRSTALRGRLNSRMLLTAEQEIAINFNPEEIVDDFKKLERNAELYYDQL